MEKMRVVHVPSTTVHRDLPGEAMLLQLDTGEYYGLDDVGNRFWQLILEIGDLDRIRERLLEEYDVDAEVLAADLEHLLHELVERKLVVMEEPPSA